MDANTEPWVQSIVIREKGCHPYQIVVMKAEDSPHEQTKARILGEGHCYSTHLLIRPENREPYMVSGHYDMTLDEAMEDFHKRLVSDIKLRR